MPKKKKNTIEEDELNVNHIEIDISKIKPNPSIIVKKNGKPFIINNQKPN